MKDVNEATKELFGSVLGLTNLLNNVAAMPEAQKIIENDPSIQDKIKELNKELEELQECAKY